MVLGRCREHGLRVTKLAVRVHLKRRDGGLADRQLARDRGLRESLLAQEQDGKLARREPHRRTNAES